MGLAGGMVERTGGFAGSTTAGGAAIAGPGKGRDWIAGLAWMEGTGGLAKGGSWATTSAGRAQSAKKASFCLIMILVSCPSWNNISEIGKKVRMAWERNRFWKKWPKVSCGL